MNEKNVNENVELSFLEAFTLGIKVIFSEIHWHLLRGLRLWEIKQLKRRLENEYQKMGQLSRKESETQEFESQKELCNNQIEFLEKEIEFLEKELEKLHNDIISKRRQKWVV